MDNCKKFYRPTCDEVRLLMTPIWAGTRGINDEERRLFQAHLNVCPACAKEYEETKELMYLVKSHWGQISIETQELLEQAGNKVTEPGHISSHRGHPITIKESWQNLCKRCPDLTENKKNLKIFPLIIRISAVAACLVFVFISWFIFSNNSKQYLLPQASSSNRQVASALTSSVKIELVVAFVQWLKYASENKKAPSPYYSTKVCKYLTETRSLFWFVVKEGKLTFVEKQQIEAFGLLKKEVITACNCKNDLLYPPQTQRPEICKEDISKRKVIPKLIADIGTMKTREEYTS